MATEADGFWAERAWLFMVLCRQIGIDVGLITYRKSDMLELQVPRYELNFDATTRRKVPIVWICAALIDDQVYLFDARLGLEIPGPDSEGVATLEEALADPVILERMNLPGLAPGTSRASLLSSPTKIGILIDSSPGYSSPKMKLLQAELSGKHRTILYRDPADERDQFARALATTPGSSRYGRSPWRSTLGFLPMLATLSRSRLLFSCSAPNGPCFTRGSNNFGVNSIKPSKIMPRSGSMKILRWSIKRNR